MIRLEDFLVANPGACVHGPVRGERFERFCFDSRITGPGELFLAVRTARADGHDFVVAACRAGATGAVCQRPMDLAELGATCVVVDDTEEAIRRYAAYVVRAWSIPVIGITGSAGKTTTKEMLAHALESRLCVFRNPANYSGRFGLAVALGELTARHEIAVVEMSVDEFAEMSLLCAMAPPEVAAVTVVAPAHLAAFGDLDSVAREKGGIVAALPPGGLAVLNADDPRVAAMAVRSAAPVVWVGRAEGPAGRSLDWAFRKPRVDRGGTTFDLVARGLERTVRLPWLGDQFALSACITLAVCDRYGIDADQAAERLANLPPIPGRLRPLDGRNGSLILDDTYNASPAAVLAALDVLAALPAGRRVVVLGGMAELGDGAEDLHRAVGRRAAQVADLLVTRGREAEWIADEARSAMVPPASVQVTYTAEDAVAAVEPVLAEDTVVLAKGSAVARMEQVVAGLMADPSRARQLLVRQDAAWQQIVVLQPDRPTWLEIDLGAVAANVSLLKRLAGAARLMAVLKADAYGHGAVQVAHTALRNGASCVGVACLSEGEALRRAGIEAPILVLGYTPAWQVREALRLDLTLAVFDADTARAIGQAARALARPARVHLKVDTGMHRLGVHVGAAGELLGALAATPGLVVEGIFTHLATADDDSAEGRTATDAQLAAFDGLLARLDNQGLRPPIAHVANTAVLLGRQDARYEMVRPGIGLYGLAPSSAMGDRRLAPALTWKSQIAQVHDLGAGEAVGYGRAWSADRPSRVAVVPVGYADGFRRTPQGWRHVLVRGRPAPVVGRVSMDQAAIDVTDVPGARQGDEVVLIGRQGDGSISVDTVAAWLGTIGYEVVAAILARVPRVS